MSTYLQPYSVCIIAHNEAKSIGKTLDTLAIQTHKPSEVLVWANGCTDNTAQIARDMGATVFEHDFANKPTGWNELNKLAKYNVRVFADGDVFIPPRSCERLVETLQVTQTCVSAARLVPQYDAHSHLTRLVFPVHKVPQTYICGRLYALDYDKFLNTAQEKQVPTDILHEDGWLQLVTGYDFFVSSARVLYKEYSFFELPKICRRYHDASVQLRKRYSHLKRSSASLLTRKERLKSAIPYLVAKTLHTCLRKIDQSEGRFVRSEHSKYYSEGFFF
jgi:glycosyltransferase involved in cell wall biosynthesis